MDKDYERAKEREKRRWDEYDQRESSSDHTPMNDAMDHFSKIEGYPTKKPAKMKSLPLPIRIVGYLLLGIMALSLLVGLVLNFI
ncbi:hypothetical protein JNUCC1_02409 [Lentibacillus sp. JNUCC-1]|uniref:hypothetical protein n=1 Tax=Lentibacillus sp. JNUCC-1 TaxID=2654513 RepID=UPI0012E8ADC6|nr:hypothetical protein [Lentibacillus sp. JNUCC-1]MUV38555.1 hypothetical protein [Lentibacillus sp. JNUCC-1]